MSGVPPTRLGRRGRRVDETDDWRLSGQERYLTGVSLQWADWHPPRPEWDHDHCEFCWAKFVDPAFSEWHARVAREDPKVLTEGYATLGTGPAGQDDYHWICDACFADFRTRFKWRVAGTN